MNLISIRRAARCAMLVTLAIGFGSASAQVLYKLVGPDGKVTYSQSVPKSFEGRVVPLDMSASPNAVPPSSVHARTPAENEAIILRRPPNNDAAIEAARARVQLAQAALDDARDNSTAEDWQYVAGPVGTGKGGGTSSGSGTSGGSGNGGSGNGGSGSSMSSGGSTSASAAGGGKKKARGAAHRVPTEEYAARLEQLEQDLRLAQEALKAAEQAS